jgi:hypothetical protein
VAFKYFKTFEKDSLADGSTYSETWYPDEDIVIKRIYIVNKAGTAWTDSEFYLKVKEDVYTLDVVPAVILGQDVQSTPELNIPVAAKQLVNFIFTNNEGAAVSLYVVFECWSAA